MGGVAIVTGSTGFIGSRLVEHLVAEGYRVRCLTRPQSPRNGPVSASVERHVVDFADPSSLRRSPALDDADVVFHLAGATRALDLGAFRAANVAPTAALLRALVERKGAPPRFLLVSSQAAAGPAAALDAPVRESDPARPIEAYGLSKLEGEAEALRWASVVPVTIVRPCSVYGPGDADFLALFRMAARGLVVYPGTRDHYLCLLHVDDAVRGIVAAARTPEAVGETFFLTGRSPVRWHELGGQIAAAANSRLREVDLPGSVVRALAPLGDAYARLAGRVGLLNRHKVALAAPRYWVCAGDRATTRLGFVPATDLATGVGSTYSWYLGAGWLGGPRADVRL